MTNLCLSFRVPVDNYPPKSIPIDHRRVGVVSQRILRQIAEEVGAIHGFRAEELIPGGHGTWARAYARHEIMWRLRQRGCSYPAIARAMGMKEHTAVMHGVKRHAERMG